MDYILPKLGKIVIYHLNDGKGGSTDRAGVVVKVNKDDVNLKVFAMDANETDITICNIKPGTGSNQYEIQ